MQHFTSTSLKVLNSTNDGHNKENMLYNVFLQYTINNIFSNFLDKYTVILTRVYIK